MTETLKISSERFFAKVFPPKLLVINVVETLSIQQLFTAFLKESLYFYMGVKHGLCITSYKAAMNYQTASIEENPVSIGLCGF